MLLFWLPGAGIGSAAKFIFGPETRMAPAAGVVTFRLDLPLLLLFSLWRALLPDTGWPGEHHSMSSSGR